MVELLSATMTVGNETFESSSSGWEYTGYYRHPSDRVREDVGSITDNTFNIAWDEYVVQELRMHEVDLGENRPNELLILLKLDQGLPTGSILELDGVDFPTAGNERETSGDETPFYQWSEGAPSWSEGQQVQVRVLTPKFNVPVAVEASFGAAEYYAAENGQTAEVEVLLDRDPEREVASPGHAFTTEGGAASSDFAVSDILCCGFSNRERPGRPSRSRQKPTRTGTSRRAKRLNIRFVGEHALRRQGPVRRTRRTCTSSTR